MLAPVIALTLTLGPAQALERGAGADGIAWVSGGVGHDEQVQLHAESARHALWVVTAARRSGAHLAGVHVHIKDAQGRTVIDHTLDGPWLLATLPAGRYDIEASLLHPGLDRLELQHRRTQIVAGQRRQVFFYFDTGDATSGEPGHFTTNPYAVGAPAR